MRGRMRCTTMRTLAMASMVALGVTANVAAEAGAATGSGDQPGSYVALGDSYTAGPLINLSFETSQVPVGCAQSRASYPYLVAAALHATSLHDVSCSGATTGNFTQPQGVLPNGVNPPEFDALSPKTSLVTIGMGGNDVDLVGLALDCVNLVPIPVSSPPLGASCAARDTSGGVDRYGQAIEAFGPKFGADLREVHRLAPNAKVFVVGYPDVLPMSGDGCWPYVPLLPADMQYVRDKVEQLNAVEEAESKANGATFVDTWTSSIGHDACEPIGTAWVNAVVVVPSSFPLHPNAMGEANDAAQVVKAVRASGWKS